MVIALTEQDSREINFNYPILNCSKKRGVIWGTLELSCWYDSERNELIYSELGPNHIKDSYEVRIEFNEKDSFGFPQVYEDSEIIKNFALSEGITLEDFHINKDDADSCCLGIFPEYRWSSASAFIHDKVIPFFYWQSYRRIYGKEPWKGYSHGPSGLLEAMCLPPNESPKGYNRNKPCPCGSGQKYKKCCLMRDAALRSKLAKNEN